jgi:hypothetical protein
LKWYKIASRRVNSIWWDAVLAPLKELEAGATGGMFHMEKQQSEDLTEHEKVNASRKLENPTLDVVPGNAIFGKSNLEISKESGKKIDVESSPSNSFAASRSALEDMELETRALTEPLPTNQQVRVNCYGWIDMVVKFQNLDFFFSKICFTICRPTKTINFMLLKDGLLSIRRCIQRVPFLVFVLVIQFTHGVVCKHSRPKKDGCGKGCKLKLMSFL